jgi:predicted deacylase
MNEQVLVHVDDYSYEKYLWSLLTEANQRDIPFEIIGRERSEYTGIEYPLYRMVIHPQEQKTICLIAGVHGVEIAGPLSILRLLQISVAELPNQYRYLIYPMINPTGFDLRQRFDDDYRDLNAIYSKTLSSKNYVEVQELFEDFQKFTPFDAVIALHEDSDLEKFYMYGLGEQNTPYYHELCNSVNHFCHPWANADIYGDQSDEFGLIHADARDFAYDGYLYAHGLTPVAMTLETPGKLDIHLRVNMMANWIVAAVKLLEKTELRGNPTH